MKRRKFISVLSWTATGLTVLPAVACQNGDEIKNADLGDRGSDREAQQSEDGEFKLPELDYYYSSIEPYIDRQTMEIHHSKHHAGYVKKLNDALKDHRLKGNNLEEILTSVSSTEKDRDVLNNAGGHYNHSLYWKIISPVKNQKPSPKLKKALLKNFGTVDNFKAEFKKAASGVFGSGWAWLVLDENKDLFITTTRNQENPIMKKVVSEPGTPLLGIDVWEHAYYLKYQNKRSDYIESFLEIINWEFVSHRYEKQQ